MKEVFTKKNLIKAGIMVVMCFVAPFILGWQLERCTIIDTYNLLWNAYRWNVFILCLIELIIFLCTLSFKWTQIIYVVFITIVYFTNHFVFEFRGRMLTWSDITAIGTASKVAFNYSYKPTVRMVICLAIGMALIIVACTVNLSNKKKWYVHLAGIVLAGVLAFTGERVFIESDFLLSQKFIVSTGFIQSIQYDGYMVASCLHFKDSKFEAPDNYSREECIEELNKYNPENSFTTEESPHVIFVLNESFADMTVDGNLQIDHDVFEKFYSNPGIKVRGYANASVLGGGTANTEFEIFTASSMLFFPSTYYPYQQCIISEKESIVSCFKNAGYVTYSMHPEPSSNWNRKNVYSYLDFDHSYWKDDFPEEAEIIGNGISDAETYKKIIEIYENNADNVPLFIFDMTMQNHGGYTHLELEPTVHMINYDYYDAEAYMSLVEQSIKSFTELTSYFENVNEPVMIVFLGDHQPKFDDDFYDFLSEQTPDMTYEEMYANMYRTPFVIWTNYDAQCETGVELSMNYVGKKILDYAGVPSNSYIGWVSGLQDKYPVVTANVVRDKDGNSYYRDNLPEELLMYEKLQYRFLFDE